MSSAAGGSSSTDPTSSSGGGGGSSGGGAWNSPWSLNDTNKQSNDSTGASSSSSTANTAEPPKVTSWAQAVSGECSSTSKSDTQCASSSAIQSNMSSNVGIASNVTQSHHSSSSRPSSVHSDSSTNRIAEEDSNGNNGNVVALSSKLYQPSQLDFEQLIQTELYSRDWGRSVINHETSWEGAAGSKSSKNNDSINSSNNNHSAWKQSNNGTELWESNVRQGKSSNNQTSNLAVGSVAGSAVGPVAKPSNSQWTTPASHIGGTWGEEEEDTGNMWTGVPNPNAPSQIGKEINNHNSNLNQRNSVPSIPDVSTSTKSWLPEEPVVRHNWNSDNESNASKWGNPKPEFGFNDAKDESESWSNKAAALQSTASSAGWEDQNLAAATITQSSNASASLDDGTALWGAPQGQNKVLLWKDENDRTRNPNEPLASSPGVLRIPSNVNKDSWKQPGKPFPNAINKFPPNFGPIKKNNWNEPESDKMACFAGSNASAQLGNAGSNWSDNATLYWNKQKRNYAASGQVGNGASFGGNLSGNNSAWNDGGHFVNSNDWSNLKSKPLSREMIVGSNQYKMLVDQGFKKEDVENVLRQCNMNIDESIDELRSTVLRDMDLEMEKRNKSQMSASSGLPQSSGNLNRPSNQLNPNSAQPGMMQSNQLQPMMMQGIQSINYVMNNPEELMNLRQDKLLFSYIQSVQLGVQEGHLSCQLLNQPIAFSSIKLICSLLDKIRYFQQLQMKINSLGPNPNNPVLKIYLLQQAETKQHIQHFQKLISQEQNMFLSQQEAFLNRQTPAGSFANKQFENKSIADLNQLTADLNSIQLGAIGMQNGPASSGQPQLQFQQSNAAAGQSRLSQWKMDSNQLDKPEDMQSKFNRAPGVNVKATNVAPCNSWSAGICEPWESPNSFEKSNSNLLSASAPNQAANQSAFNQFGLQQVAEFEPGKAWKQSQMMKPNESQAQPVPINKEQPYWPTPAQPSPSGDSLVGSFASTSTWSFPGGNGSGSGGGSGNAGIGTPLNIDEHQVNGWPGSNMNSSNGSDMWNRSKPKGPPPGLGGISSGKSNQANPWSPDDQSANSTWNQAVQNNSNVSFLLFRNLVQVDPSTLKTLCMQHGSLQMFHFQPEAGVALVKYANRDQALKAKMALNQFSFGNSTVIAELPTEQQVQQIQNALQQSPSAQQSTNMYAPIDASINTNVVANGWSTVGPPQPPSSAALWSYSQMPMTSNHSGSQANGSSANNNGASIWQTIDSNPNNLLPSNLLGESS